MLISNGKSTKTTGTLDRTVGQLTQAGVTYVVCSKIHENPSKECVMGSAAFVKEMEYAMSDYGFTKDKRMTLAVNARETMGGLSLANPCEWNDEDCTGIFEKSYR